MSTLKSEIERLKAMKRANAAIAVSATQISNDSSKLTNESIASTKYVRQKEIIEEKIKEAFKNEDKDILRNFSELENNTKEWYKNQEKIFQPSDKYRNTNSSFFNFRKCEKPEKPNINKLKSAIASKQKENEGENEEVEAEEDKGLNDLVNNLNAGSGNGNGESKALDLSALPKKAVDSSMTKEVVFERLRKIKAPVTLFGETLRDRIKRLSRLESGESEEKIYGTQDRKEYVETKVETKDDTKANAEELSVSNFDDDMEFDGNLDFDEEEGKFQNRVRPEKAIEFQKDSNSTIIKKFINTEKFSNDFKNEELYTWFQRMFYEWERELTNEITPELRKTAEGRQRVGIFRQCKRYIKPLMKHFKNKNTPLDIIDKLFEVMIYCMDRDYVRANDKYIEIAIGNAPWPVGVTMVGIHERSGRSKIFNSQVAHILNDETQKRYLQSVKRVMSLCQRLYSTTPSKSVFS